MIKEVLQPEILVPASLVGTLLIARLSAELKKQIKVRDGIDPKDFRRFSIHHIESQYLAKKKLKWRQEQIDHPDNLIALEKTYHTEIHQDGRAETLKNKFRHRVRENTIQAKMWGWRWYGD